ncbi:MAG: DNA polymerase beta domain-containing [Geobacteraceae bacterium]|nr:MAG: DNA polymerase beta domain-containing [Geobacteraceae bacterium]
MTTFDDINRTLHDHLEELRQIYGVAEIGVFGSFVRGEQREDSDVDILVELSRPVGFVAFVRLEEHLQTLLGRKVDLVSKKALKPYIGRLILDEVRYVA